VHKISKFDSGIVLSLLELLLHVVPFIFTHADCASERLKYFFDGGGGRIYGLSSGSRLRFFVHVISVLLYLQELKVKRMGHFVTLRLNELGFTVGLVHLTFIFSIWWLQGLKSLMVVSGLH